MATIKAFLSSYRSEYDSPSENGERGNRLNKDLLTEALYIYQLSDGENSCVGLWAVTDYNDIWEGRISAAEAALNHPEQGGPQTALPGTDAMSLTIAYQPDPEVQQEIQERMTFPPSYITHTGKASYRIWEIDQPETVGRIVRAFAKLGTTFLVNGSIDMAGRLIRVKGQSLYLNDRGRYFSTLYVPTDVLKISAFHRLFLPDEPVDVDLILYQLGHKFAISKLPGEQPYAPKDPRSFGLYVAGSWYRMVPRHLPDDLSFQAQLDISILYDVVLKEIGLRYPGRDPRLTAIGGHNALALLAEKLSEQPAAMGFTLFPPSVNQVVSAAYTGSQMPADTVWIDPGIPNNKLFCHLYEKAHETA